MEPLVSGMFEEDEDEDGDEDEDEDEDEDVNSPNWRDTLLGE
jgi:hypothetical protein